MNEKIYLVMVTEGVYSDRWNSPKMAFTDKRRAEYEVEKLQAAHHTRLGKLDAFEVMMDDWQSRNPPPKMTIDWDDSEPEWEVQERFHSTPEYVAWEEANSAEHQRLRTVLGLGDEYIERDFRAYIVEVPLGE